MLPTATVVLTVASRLMRLIMLSQQAGEGKVPNQTESPSASDATARSQISSASPNSPGDSTSHLAVMFPNDLALYRKRAGLTQRELSLQTKIPRSRLSLWEGGKAIPSFSEAKRLAEYFHVGISELFPNPRVRDFIASA